MPIPPPVPPTLQTRLSRTTLRLRLSATNLHLSFKQKTRSLLPENPEKRHRVNLLDLPPNILTLIYAHYLNLHLPAYLPISASPFQLTLPPLYLTCTRTRTALSPLLLRFSVLAVHSPLALHVLTLFLRAHPHLAPGVRALEFGPGVVWRPSMTGGIAMLLRVCSEVRSVRVYVGVGVVVDTVRVERPFVVTASKETGGVPRRTRSKRQSTLGGKEKGKEVAMEVVFKPEMRARKEVPHFMDLSLLLSCAALEEVALVCVGGAKVGKKMATGREVVFMHVVGWVRRNVCYGGVRLGVKYKDEGVKEVRLRRGIRGYI